MRPRTDTQTDRQTHIDAREHNTFRIVYTTHAKCKYWQVATHE